MTVVQFQALALAWLAGITVLIPVLFAVLRLFLAEWRSLRSTQTALQARTEALDRVVNGGPKRVVRATDLTLEQTKGVGDANG